MSLKAGRVGVALDQVDEFGKIKSEATSGYTKQEADAKFETQEAAALLQPKTLALPISMLEGSSLVSKTTVEEVIQTMNNAMTNQELTEQFDYVSADGYAKAGNVVVLNCAVTLTQALTSGWNSNHPDFSKFPIPVQNCILNVYDRTGQSQVLFMFSSGGILPDKAYTVGNNFYITGAYLTTN